jgi:hypothetical protein
MCTAGGSARLPMAIAPEKFAGGSDGRRDDDRYCGNILLILMPLSAFGERRTWLAYDLV